MENYGLNLLEKELSTLLRCKEKSIESYNNKSISKETNDLHISNLDPKIENLKKCIDEIRS